IPTAATAIATAAASATATASAAAAAAATAAATTAAAEAAAATTAAAEAAATAAAGCALTGLIHGQVATVKLLPMERADGCLCLLLARHLNETEAPGLPGHPVRHHLNTDRLDPCPLKGPTNAVLRGVKGQIPHIQSLAHLPDSPCTITSHDLSARNPGS